MRILDLTHALTLQSNNYYVFNPSIVHLYQTYYLISYRVCKYNMNKQCHPWEIWKNGYKDISNNDEIAKIKYRKRTDPVTFSLNKGCTDCDIDSYDSTGMALVEYSNEQFIIIYNCNSVFGNDMKQDARLHYRNECEFIMTYNTFEMIDGVCNIIMKRRNGTFIKDRDNPKVVLSEESNMFSHIYRPVEKNCVYMYNSNLILYGLTHTSIEIMTDRLHQVHTNAFQNIKKSQISCSSPVIPFDENYLSCGHIKTDYKEDYHHLIEKDRIFKHGRYIYCSFFFVFDRNFNVLKVSQPFIPTQFKSHLPYLLCMPTGLVQLHTGDYCMAYGEGDTRSKCLILSKEEIHSLLCSELDGKLYYLTTCYRIHHFGYYNQNNCGDESYKTVFQYFRNKYYPEVDITFTEKYDPNEPDVVVFGGGDVCNDYFLNEICKYKAPKLAVGVGVPFDMDERHLAAFKHIAFRNHLEVNRYQMQYPVSYTPDLSFFLPPLDRKCTRGKIGISVMQPYYSEQYSNLYEEYIDRMITLCNSINTSVVLFAFCTKDSPTENDLIAAKRIQEKCKNGASIVSKHIYEEMSTLEFMVCGRFHSHIFATLLGLPFISLTCGKKCIEYIKEVHLETLMYKFPVNELYIPQNIDSKKISSLFHYHYNNRNIVTKLVLEARQSRQNYIAAAEKEYVRQLTSLLQKGKVKMIEIT